MKSLKFMKIIEEKHLTFFMPSNAFMVIF